MKQLLPFKVGYETYALNLVEVQEVVENQKIYPFPGSPKAIAGAIAFHGRIVPVINLALLLDFPAAPLGARLIVLINARGPVALGVDQVQSIINLEPHRLNSLKNCTEQNYICDIVNVEGQMVGLFDLDKMQLMIELLCAQAGG